MKTILVWLPVLIAAISVWLKLRAQKKGRVFPGRMYETDAHANAPTRALDGDALCLYGRYRSPIRDVNVRLQHALEPWRLKRWHYTSIATPRFFIGVAVVNLGYVGTTFCYVVDRKKTGPSSMHEYSSLSPFALNVSFAPSSLIGKTLWKSGSNIIELEATEDGWDICLNVVMPSKKKLVSRFHMKREEGLGLLFPMENDGSRPAYTHKGSAMECHGTIEFDGEKEIFGPGKPTRALGTIDWTKSYARRVTKWNWASCAHILGDGKKFGMNLSRYVYDYKGVSQENVVWYDGDMHFVGIVKFIMPEKSKRETEEWKLQTDPDDSVEINLSFTPAGTRKENLNVGLIASDFVQPFGYFNGTITIQTQKSTKITILLQNAYGVVEDHLAVW